MSSDEPKLTDSDTGARAHSSGPDSDEVEQQGRLLAALSDLDEPFRSAVLRHYFRGESIATIARDDGVAETVIRMRLARGMECLRARLGTDTHRGHFAWIAWLPALFRRAAGPGHGSAPLGAGTRLLGAAFALALVCVVCFTLQALWGESEGSRELSGAALDRTESHVSSNDFGGSAIPDSSRLSADAQVDERKQEPSIATRAVVRLRATDGRGRPVATAEATCGGMSGEDAQFQPSAAISDRDGVILLVVERSLEHSTRMTASTVGNWVRLTAPGHVEKTLFVTATFGREIDMGDIVIERAASIRGCVVDASGAPLANIDVVLTLPELDMEEQAAWPAGRLGKRRALETARTDSKGGYDLTQVRPGPVRLWAIVHGWTTHASEVLDLQEGERTDVPDLVLPQRSGALIGVVLDGTGRPLEGARVDRLLRGSWMLGLTTDSRGRFAVDLMGAETVELHVFDPRGRFGALRVPGAAARDEETTYVLPAVSRARILVRDETGAPVRRFSHSINYVDSPAILKGDVEDASGSFELTVPATSSALVISAHGFAIGRLQGLENTRDGAEVVIALERASILSGRLTEQSGAPAVGYELALLPVLDVPRLDPFARFPDRFDFRAGGTETRTTERGEFELTCRVRSEWMLIAEVDGRTSAAFGPFPAGIFGPTIDLRLPAPGGIEGRLLVPDGIDLAGLWVGASIGAARVVRARVDRNGHFELRDLAPGRWWLNRLLTDDLGTPTRAPAGTPAVVVEVRESETSHVVLDFTQSWEGGLSGTLLWPGVELRGWSAVFSSSHEKSWSPPESLALERNGTFAFPAVPKGAAVLCLRDEARGPIRREVRMELELAYGDRVLDLHLSSAIVRLSKWASAPGLVFVTRTSGDAVVNTVLRPGPAHTDRAIVLPAGRTELFELGPKGGPIGPALWSAELTPGSESVIDR